MAVFWFMSQIKKVTHVSTYTGNYRKKANYKLYLNTFLSFMTKSSLFSNLIAAEYKSFLSDTTDIRAS